MIVPISQTKNLEKNESDEGIGAACNDGWGVCRSQVQGRSGLSCYRSTVCVVHEVHEVSKDYRFHQPQDPSMRIVKRMFLAQPHHIVIHKR